MWFLLTISIVDYIVWYFLYLFYFIHSFIRSFVLFCFVLFPDAHHKSLGLVFITLHDLDNNWMEKAMEGDCMVEHIQLQINWRHIQNSLKVSNSLFYNCRLMTVTTDTQLLLLHPCRAHVVLSLAACPVIRSEDYCWNRYTRTYNTLNKCQ